MNIQEILNRYRDEALTFLADASSCMVILTDSQHRILDCSCAFPRTLGIDNKPAGKKLQDLIAPLKDGEEFILPVSKGKKPTSRTFRSIENNVLIRCCTFPAGEGFLVFAESVRAADSGIIQKMSALNKELSVLTQDLSKRNRELRNANNKITELMRTDPLTGLANRRYFSERFEEAVSFARRSGCPLSLIMADLDFFKSVNDHFGHEAGDEVLKGFAALISNCCRREDLGVRMGGEEFLIMLQNTDRNGALTLAERIRKLLENSTFCDGKIKVTVSIGAAMLEANENPQDLIKRADKAMYLAKEKGRNRCECLR